jgi:flagellar M-ring protein FliF
VSASVVLFTKPGSDMATNRKKILGVQKLLQAAVEGLKEENITITDSSGIRLNDFEGMAANDELELIAKSNKLVAQMETDYSTKILSSLQKTFSEDRVRDLNIKIAMDMSKKQSEILEYGAIVKTPDNPDTPYDDSVMVDYLPLEMQNVEKTWTGQLYSPEGPAGTAGNTPPNYADMNNVNGTSTEKGTKQTNAVNSKKTIEERKPNIDRVTVSVNIDGTWTKKYDEKGKPVVLPNGSVEREYTPLTPQQIDAATGLVRNAIGYNAARGDAVSVLNIPFDRTAQFDNEDFALMRAARTQRTVIILIGGVLALIILFVVIRQISKVLKKRRDAKEAAEERRRQAEEEERLFGATQEAARDVNMTDEERRRAELMGNVESLAREHPEDVAQLIRTWLMQEA